MERERTASGDKRRGASQDEGERPVRHWAVDGGSLFGVGA